MRRYIKDIFTGEYRWVDDTGGVVRYGEAKRTQRHHNVMRDIEPFVSPVDGKVVSSRSAKREHMRRHDLEEVGNERLKPKKYEPLPPVTQTMVEEFKRRGIFG